MSKKTIKKTTKPLSPRPAVKQDDTVYLVREDLDAEQERLRSTPGPEAGPLQAPAPAQAADQPPAPAVVPLQPLAPLAALWPDPVPPKRESKPAPAPAAPPKVPVAAPASKPALAPAAPSAKPPAQSAPPTSPDKSAGPAQAPKAAAAKTVNVTFALHKPDAKQVLLGGDFNGWATGATPMKRHEDGHWETTIALAPGRYEYKFLVDGQWIPDPAAQKNVRNQHGTLNSVIEVRA